MIKGLELALKGTDLTDMLETGFETQSDIEFELERLLKARKEAVAKRKAAAPRGAFRSYITMSHNGDYIEAGYEVRRAKEVLASFLKPHIEALRSEGKTWKAVAEEIGVTLTIINECR